MKIKLILAGLLVGLLAVPATAETKLKKEKLQIVFLMGQSNMVGLAEPDTAVYLMESAYVPPKDFVTKRSEFFDWPNLFWQGVRTFKGPHRYKQQLDELVEARHATSIRSNKFFHDMGRSDWLYARIEPFRNASLLESRDKSSYYENGKTYLKLQQCQTIL